MGDRNQPPEPSPEALVAARAVLDDLAADIGTDPHFVLGYVGSCLDCAATDPATGGRHIERARAMLAVHRERRAVES